MATTCKLTFHPRTIFIFSSSAATVDFAICILLNLGWGKDQIRSKKGFGHETKCLAKQVATSTHTMIKKANPWNKKGKLWHLPSTSSDSRSLLQLYLGILAGSRCTYISGNHVGFSSTDGCIYSIDLYSDYAYTHIIYSSKFVLVWWKNPSRGPLGGAAPKFLKMSQFREVYMSQK